MKVKTKGTAAITYNDEGIQKIFIDSRVDFGLGVGGGFLLHKEGRELRLKRVGRDSLLARTSSREDGKISAVKLSGMPVDDLAAALGNSNVFKSRMRENEVDLMLSAVPPYYMSGAYKKMDIRDRWTGAFGVIAARLRAGGHTLLDFDRLYTLWQSVKNVRDLRGAIVEVGVYKGGSSALLAEAQIDWGKTGRLYACDTFQGHVEATAEHDAEHRPGMFGDTDEAAVRRLLQPYDTMTVLAGDIRQTSASIPDTEFALLHLDVDVFQVTTDCLDHFGPRMERGGVIVVDDYACTTCPGVKAAVDAYAKANPNFSFLHLLAGQALLTRMRA